MNLVKNILVNLIAAIAARPPPRKSGLDAYVAAMIWLAPALGLPVFFGLLGVLWLATYADPIAQQPYLDFGAVAIVCGMMLVEWLVKRWRDSIEAVLSCYDQMPNPARLRRRALILTPALVALLAGYTLLLKALWP
jgi:hypothetical protein